MLKDAGRSPSRMDLAQYFELGGAEGTLPARGFPQRHTTGPDIGHPTERVIPVAYGGLPDQPLHSEPDYTVKIGRGTKQVSCCVGRNISAMGSSLPHVPAMKRTACGHAGLSFLSCMSCSTILSSQAICRPGERVEKAKELFCRCKATGLVQGLA